ERVQELHDFSKHGEECLDKGVLGDNRSLAYLLSNRHCFDKVLKEPKKANLDDE
ncbi:hypothetical protein HAX54_031890, partial [Datura stramonium]|nr:hypothetical protein [Datura stramonium]